MVGVELARGADRVLVDRRSSDPVYPNAESGLFLKGGVGFARREVVGFPSTFEDGAGVIGGLGFDARVGSNFSVSPYANFVYASANDESMNTFQIGLGVTWH